MPKKMTIRDNETDAALMDMVQEARDIAENISAGFNYEFNRQPVLHELLSKSGQN